MSPFGKKDPPGASEYAACTAEVDRLGGLDLRQLGAEVMRTGFGPTCPDPDGMPTPKMIADVFVPGAARSSETDQYELLQDLVWEGVQVLEHASLVRFAVYSSEGGKFFKLTRLGQAALEKDAVDRVLGGGSL
jgi:hypothetical protein